MSAAQVSFWTACICEAEVWSACFSCGSSALQVLVSIQSLIFVDEPYYCEPGYESFMHTERGTSASKAYNLYIR